MEDKTNKSPWIVITELDGSGKNTLINNLSKKLAGKIHIFHLPFSNFVIPGLEISGGGDPFTDSYTDRLLFATDARLTNYKIQKWRLKYDYLISARGWVDNYIFASVQGYGYKFTTELLKINDLEKPTTNIFLVSEPEIAFENIDRSRYMDKFETIEFLHKQHKEINNFLKSVKNKGENLEFFHDIPQLLIDTTKRSEQQVLDEAIEFLNKNKLV